MPFRRSLCQAGLSANNVRALRKAPARLSAVTGPEFEAGRNEAGARGVVDIDNGIFQAADARDDRDGAITERQSWVRPQGSNRDGTASASQPAWIRWASGSS